MLVGATPRDAADSPPRRSGPRDGAHDAHSHARGWTTLVAATRDDDRIGGASIGGWRGRASVPSPTIVARPRRSSSSLVAVVVAVVRAAVAEVDGAPAPPRAADAASRLRSVVLDATVPVMAGARADRSRPRDVEVCCPNENSPSSLAKTRVHALSVAASRRRRCAKCKMFLDVLRCTRDHGLGIKKG